MADLTNRGTPRQRHAPIKQSHFLAIKRSVAQGKASGADGITAQVAAMHGVSISTVNEIRRAGSWPKYLAVKDSRRQARIKLQERRRPSRNKAVAATGKLENIVSATYRIPPVTARNDVHGLKMRVGRVEQALDILKVCLVVLVMLIVSVTLFFIGVQGAR